MLGKNLLILPFVLLQETLCYINIIFDMSSSINQKYSNIITNEPLNESKVDCAEKIISELQTKMPQYTSNGAGPFIAAIYDENGKCLVETSNTVVNEGCSHNHAEINAIREVEKKLGTYDLSSYNLSLYITAEPCMMCIGAIMWSGIKNIYYGISSKTVERITGFDEGFKPGWLDEFKKRGIIVYGNILPELGESAMQKYIEDGYEVYKPQG